MSGKLMSQFFEHGCHIRSLTPGHILPAFPFIFSGMPVATSNPLPPLPISEKAAEDHESVADWNPVVESSEYAYRVNIVSTSCTSFLPLYLYDSKKTEETWSDPDGL